MDLKYQRGFGNFFASESMPGALPTLGNTPQKTPFGLFAEQLSGSAFTTDRKENYRTWFYRLRASVVRGPYTPFAHICDADTMTFPSTPPNPMRWSAFTFPAESKDFLDSMVPLMTSGNWAERKGASLCLYRASKSMEERFFCNNDGDYLLIPQSGSLLLQTEFGIMTLQPGEFAVIQRGMTFQVRLTTKKAYGYLCENFGQSFELPNLGPIGANGLALPQDFLTPVASYENRTKDYQLVTKHQNKFWQCQLTHSPMDVVAWRGNYAPYKYDLKKFNVVNSVSFDHMDPSIFTVLTSPSHRRGQANMDFVVFPPRWLVSENTFRPPYFHRNIMSEYMGLIHGTYDGKQSGGFAPGGSSLHNCMVPHGPDSQTYEKAINQQLHPQYLNNSLAFMVESFYQFHPTCFSLKDPAFDETYGQCWQGMPETFTLTTGK